MTRPKVALLGLGSVMRSLIAILADNGIYNSGDTLDIALVTEKDKYVGCKADKVFREKETAISDILGIVPKSCPESLEKMTLSKTDLELIASQAQFAFSALPSDIALTIEQGLVGMGVPVFSHSPAHRDEAPLIILGVNYKYFMEIGTQQLVKPICSPNCTTQGIAYVMKALEPLREEGYVIKCIDVVTNQASTGGGDQFIMESYEWIRHNVGCDWGYVGVLIITLKNGTPCLS